MSTYLWIAVIAVVLLAGFGTALTQVERTAVPATDTYVAGRSLLPIPTPTAAAAPRFPSAAPTWIPTTPAWAPPTTASTPRSVGDALPPRSTVIMHGDFGERMRLRLGEIDDPASSLTYPDRPYDKNIQPASGHRLVAVTVEVENDGRIPFMPTVEKYTWLVDSKGRQYPLNRLMTRAQESRPPTLLDPPDSPTSNGRYVAFRIIVFEIGNNVRPVRFRLSLHPGVARKTQDWSLSPA
ncbi:hypothetical protein [Krasilnikovia sp. M28-CT-15]|uniref:hypothetical protein n=1 Tax=Krasilnikovia sp. M28-CT-15 TaxID=3373540 RepID=UPI00399C5415